MPIDILNTKVQQGFFAGFNAKKAQISWQGFIPTLNLSYIEIKDQNQATIVTLDKLHLTFHWRELIKRQWRVNRIRVEGLKCHINYLEDAITVEGLPDFKIDLNNKTQTNLPFNDLTLHNSDILLTSLYQEKLQLLLKEARVIYKNNLSISADIDIPQVNAVYNTIQTKAEELNAKIYYQRKQDNTYLLVNEIKAEKLSMANATHSLISHHFYSQMELSEEKGKLWLNLPDNDLNNGIDSSTIKLTEASTLTVFNKLNNVWQSVLSQGGLKIQETKMGFEAIAKLVADESPYIQARVDTNEFNPALLVKLLPAQLMDKDLYHWLQSAFVKGTASNSTLIMRGNWQDFPFKNNQGVFEYFTSFKDGEFYYDKEWPNLTQLNAQVHFKGPSLKVKTIQPALFGELKLMNTTAYLDEVWKIRPLLKVESRLSGKLDKAKIIINKSAISNTVGKALAPLDLRGDFSLNLNLKIPITNETNSTTQVQGNLKLVDTQLNVKPAEIMLNKLSGDIIFSDKEITSNALKANWFNEETHFKLKGKFNQQLDIMAQGTMCISDMKKWLRFEPTAHLEGKTAYQSTIQIPFNASPIQIKVNSRLQGVQINLYDLVTKSKESEVPSDLSLKIFPDHRIQIQANYAKTLNFKGQFDRLKNHWQIDSLLFNTAGIKGKALFNTRARRIDLEIDKLILPPGKSLGGATGVKHQLKVLPAVKLNITEIINGKKTFRNIQASLVPNQKGYNIAFFKANLEGANLQASGSWQYLMPNADVSLKGNLQVLDFGKLLKSLSFTQSIKGAPGLIDFNLHWQNTAPFSPHLPTLKGFVTVRLKQGQILGVNQGLGRIFNLLDLGQLPRRLMLDFKDVTSNGFLFGSLHSDIVFRNGVAEFERFIILGPSAAIQARGRANLVNERISGEVRVMPNVSGTLPLAAGLLAANPAVGAAVWVVDKLFTNKIRVIVNRYELGGTISSPQLNSLGSIKTKSANPNWLYKQTITYILQLFSLITVINLVGLDK